MEKDNNIKNSILLNMPWLYFAVIAINTLFGLQLINSFFSLLVNFLRERPSIDLTQVAIYALMTFLLVFAAGFLFMFVKKRNLFLILLLAVSALRFVVQVCRWGPLSLSASALGVILWITSLIFFISLVQQRKIKLFFTFFPAVLFGFSLNTAISGLLGTWDITWRFDHGIFLLVIILIAIQAFLAIILSGNIEHNKIYYDGFTSVFYSISAVMPFVFLQLYRFQNIAALNATAGLSTAGSMSIMIFSNVAAIAFVYLIRIKLLKVLLTVVSAILFVFAFWPGLTDAAYIMQIILGNIAGWWLLLTVLNRSASQTVQKTPWKNVSAFAVSGVLLFLFAFIYYGSYDLTLPLEGWTVLVLAAVMISVFALISVFAGFSLRNLAADVMRQRSNINSGKTFALKEKLPRYIAVLLMIGLFIMPALIVIPPADIKTDFEKKDSIRLMHYNIHQGFNIHGYQDLESIARVIEKENADIVCLNEVSRGWVINGSADVYLWLAQRLDMDYRLFMPASDLIWGNAILSRYPLNLVKSGFLPRMEAPLRRSFIYANVNLADTQIENINVVSTHLHHIEGESEKRQAQVEALLGELESFERTAICGDFNAVSGEAEIEMLHDAGLVDSALALGKQDWLTWVHYKPYERIDYIWVTPDIKISDLSVPYSTASDHLPVALSFK